MIISCSCQSAQTSPNTQKIEINIDANLLSSTQREFLSSRDVRWIQVSTFERLLGMRRKVVRELINSGDLIAHVVPEDPSTKIGFGSRAYVAVQTVPCKVCCPGHYEIDWNLNRGANDNAF